MIRPPIIPELASVVQVLASSVEVIEPTVAPSSSRVIKKAPTLALDASLALRREKSVATKEDMDDYSKLNTDIVKGALAYSLMKVYNRPFTFFGFYLIRSIFIFFICILVVGFDGGHGRRQSMHAMGRRHREAKVLVDGRHGCQQDSVIQCGGADL